MAVQKVSRKVSRIVLWFLASCVLVLAACTSSPPRGSSEKAVEDYTQLGLNYIREGNRDSARKHIQRALEIDSRSPGAHNAMALLLQTEEEYALAEKHYKKAIALDGSFTRARNNYGVFLYNLERYGDAYKQFRIAGDDVNYALRPQVLHSAGVAAYKMGEPDKAKEAWDKALVLESRSPLPHLELAQFYFDQQDFANARKYLDAFDKLSQPQARSLWLAIRIEDHFGNKDGVASKGLALRKLFPNSEENRQYQAWLNNDAKN